jgi:DNA-binding transcriptional LysR family regulator
MDKLRAMSTFVRIVDSGSLSAAAAALQLSGPSVVRSLAALERDVGVRLLNRTTRRSSLTDEGREYYERCRRVLAEVEAADALLSARQAEPQGRLRLTAPLAFGRLHIAPLVHQLMARHPAVQVELLLLDRIVDLVEEGIDLGVRIAQLPESSLVAVRVGQAQRVVCAAPRYLKASGTPETPQDLARHRCIVLAGLAPDNHWLFAARPKRFEVRPVLRTNDVDAALAACVQGIGCGQFLSYQVAAAVQAGKLRLLLSDHAPPQVPIQLVYPYARGLSPNVRAFVELARARLRQR